MKRTQKAAGLDQLGPVHWRDAVVPDFAKAPRKPWKISSRVNASMKRRKVKITLAERA